MQGAISTVFGALAVAVAGLASYSPTDPHLAEGPTHPALREIRLPPIITREEIYGVSDDPYGWRVSGDGTQLAWLHQRDGAIILTVESLADGTLQTIPLPIEPHDIGWGPGGRWLFVARDRDGNDNYRLFAIDMKATAPEPFELVTDPGISVELQQYVGDTPTAVLIAHNRRDPSVYDLYRFDLTTRQETLVAENPGDVLDWHAGRERGLFARTRRAQDGGVIVEKLVGEDTWKPLARLSVDDSLKFTGNRIQNGSILALSNRSRDKTALVRFSLEDASEEVIYEDRDADIEWVWRTGIENRPLVARSYPGRSRAHYFDAALGARLTALAEDDRSVATVQDIDTSGTVFIASVFRDSGRVETWLIDERRDVSRLLLDGSPARTDKPVSRTEPFSFTARDGLTIHGYVTVPPGSEQKRLPAVVWVHGGPFARSYWGYDPMVQLLANRGYVVLDVNFRGSTGYGRSYVSAARGEFARRMHTDLLDAMAWADGQGLIDPDRVAIGGASYGGWAAMVGLAESPDAFVAGFSINGASDLSSLVAWLSPTPNIWTDYAGDPTDPIAVADMRSRSPLHNADRIDDPLFLVHALDDNRVPVNHSQRMAKRLKQLGRPVETLWVRDEGHSIADERRYMVVAEQIELFLAAHLGGRVSRD